MGEKTKDAVMNKDERKAAIAAYKERQAAIGVFAVRCRATGKVWVGTSPNLDKVQNKIWFSLRMGSSFYRDLQAAWAQHGEAGFSFEVLERIKDLEEEGSAYIRKTQLADRARFWRGQLGADDL
jgi:hypothetical protein